MKLNVVVFGSPDIVESIKSIGRGFKEVTLIEVIYHDPNQIVELFREYQSQGDILLFGAHNSYFITQEYLNRHQININKLMLYVPYTAVSLYSSLFQVFLAESLNHNNLNQIKFSIDYPAKEELWTCLEELNLNKEQAYIKRCNFDQEIHELVTFHKKLWDFKKIDIAITSFYLVYRNLLELGVPVYRISPSKSSIHNTFKQIFLDKQKDKETEYQFAICLLDLSMYNKSDKLSGNRINKTLRLYQHFFDYGEEMQALIDWSKINQVRMITTRGEVEGNKDKLIEIIITEDHQNQFNFPVFLGIGFGRTAHEAEIKATEALSKSRLNNTSNITIIDAEGTAYELIDKGVRLEYSARSTDPKRLLIAKKTGLSIGTINKLISFTENFSSKQFTSLNLANNLGITPRSARRIINKLELANFVKVIGEEQPIGKGRPRYLYELHF